MTGSQRRTSEAVELPGGWLERPWREVRRQVLEHAERRYLVAVLTAARGRIGEAARRAGMAPRSLHQKMRKHGLRKESFREPGAPR